MTPEAILAEPARVLTQAQREHYFEYGYVCVERLIPRETLDELNAVTQRFVEASREVTQSGKIFDLAPGHSAAQPVIRRLKEPDQIDPAYWAYAKGILADVAADLVGPNVVYHHSKLNFKWYDDSDKVHWHQDAQFYPHTNYNVLAIGTYLMDTDMSNGPLAMLPGSHNGPLYDQYDEDGQWAGCLRDSDAKAIDMNQAVYLPAPAGSITIHNCRTVHFSPSSRSPEPRPLLINAYTASDAKPYTPNPAKTLNSGTLLRGEPARWADHDPRPCLIPPDWSGGYSSIYAAQAGEDEED